MSRTYASMSNELSERLSELFVQSSALYFQAKGRAPTGDVRGTLLLHDIACDIMLMSSQSKKHADVRLTLLGDGLRDAADIARGENLADLADNLMQHTKALSSFLGPTTSKGWDRGR